MGAVCRPLDPHPAPTARETERALSERQRESMDKIAGDFRKSAQNKLQHADIPLAGKLPSRKQNGQERRAGGLMGASLRNAGRAKLTRHLFSRYLSARQICMIAYDTKSGL